MSFDDPTFLKQYISREILNLALKCYTKNEITELDEYVILKISDDVQGITSLIVRAVLFYVVNGTRKSKTMIVKRLPLLEVQMVLVQEGNVFEKEVNFYNRLVKDMMQECERSDIKLSIPDCYFALTDGQHDVVVLEDLCAEGFETQGLKVGLDYDHSVLVLKALAEFHALSLAVEKKKGKALIEDYEFLTESIYSKNVNAMRAFVEDGFRGTVDLAKLIPKFETVVPELEKRIDGLWSELCQLMKPGSDLNVLCHGDLWINNLMFKYKDKLPARKPVEVKLIDFQICRYASPATDLIYFLYISMPRQARETFLPEFLGLYHTVFNSTLVKLGCTPPDYSVQELHNRYDSLKVYGIVWACVAIPLLNLDGSVLPKAQGDPEEYERFLSNGHFELKKDKFTSDSCYQQQVIDCLDEAVEIFMS